MRTKKYTDAKLGETVYVGKHSSGLEVRVLPKAGYDSVYALFGVRYGSIDTAVKNADGVFETIPEGTAHFLEHKLFESEELNAFERFEKTGASANAYTSFEKTAYLFKGSSEIEASLEILLDFVQKPFFTQETVDKEQGIIGQEIRMYQDEPDWQVMFNLLRALYKTHPVRIDIAGTQASIAEIDADLLYRLYDTFYNPANMALTVVGGVEPETVFALVDRCLIKKKGAPCERKFVPEKPAPVQSYIEQAMPVAEKQFLLGYKLDLKTPELTLAEETATDIALEALVGRSSPLFRELLDEELIDMGFGAELFCGHGYACVMIGGTSRDPEAAVKQIRAQLRKVRKQGLDPEAFERAKRKLYGKSVMCYNEIGATANLLLDLWLCGDPPFAEIAACKQVTLEQAQAQLALLQDKASALSVIVPVQKETADV